MKVSASIRPGMMPGGEKPADRGIGQDAVHDHDDARRNDDAERAGRGGDGGRERGRIAALAHGRDHDRPDRSRIGGGRAGDAAIDHAGRDIDDAEAAPQPPKRSSARSMMRRVSPPSFMMPPATRKSGIEASEIELAPTKTCCANQDGGSGTRPRQMTTRVEIAIDQATGTPV